MKRSEGQLIFIGLLLLVLTINISRVFFPMEEDPVFLSEKADYIWIEIRDGLPEPTIHQIIDGSSCRDVIKLTGFMVSEPVNLTGQLDRPVHPGARIDLTVKSKEIQAVRVSWMEASKRIALGIPLHPDRMNETDWQVLPGIGERMARKIEENRQKYGDFVVFSELRRVSGLGKKRLSHWNQYFFMK